MVQKRLKPTLREKKRYILYEGKKEDIEKAVLDFIGVLGYAKAAPVFLGKNILAINRGELDKIRASLLFSNIKILRVSGTLKKLN